MPKRRRPKATVPTRRKGTQQNAITIRGSETWKVWLEKFAAHMRSRPAAIIDLSLAKLAEQEQFPPPTPRM